MHIGVDARLISYRRGMGNFVHNLLFALAKLPWNHTLLLYVDQPEAVKCVPDDPRLKVKVLRPAFYPLWEQLLLPRQAAQDQLDALYCPTNTAPLRLSGNIELIITVHDVMYLLPNALVPISPSLYQRLGRRYRCWIVPRAVRRATHLTTVSEFSRSDIVEQVKISPDRIAVIYEAPGTAFRRVAETKTIESVKRRFNLMDRIIVSLGAMDPRKNTARVIEAFAGFQEQTSDPYQLVIAGLNARAQTHFAEQAKRLGVESTVILLGFVTEMELVALYNAAEMVLYPSLYEGFGLPLLEAMACGTPVISSQSTCIPEVVGDAALLVDPTDTNELIQAMLHVSSDEALRHELIGRGQQQAARYSWDKAARELLAVFDQAAGARQPPYP